MLCAGALADDPRHPRQQVLGRVRPREPFGERGQDLVRRRAFTEDQPVGEPVRPRAKGLERERDDDGGDDR